VRVDRRPEGLRGLLLGLVVVLALLGSALSGSAGQAHADCRGVRASFRATCVRDDVATYLSDLAIEGVRGSDQDHFNEAAGLRRAAGAEHAGGGLAIRSRLRSRRSAHTQGR
jgi:hypothetical protein